MIHIILLVVPQLCVFSQKFVGTVLKVEEDTMIDSINFEKSAENWKLSNVLMVDTGDDTVNSLYNISKHYR